MNAITSRIEELDAEARRILRMNDRGGYTVPTDGLYPYQWNWDSVFVAVGFATYDLDRAWREIETLFSGQWANGMVPHILFHKEDDRYFPGPKVWGGTGPIPSSGVSQPPVAATMARKLFDQDPSLGKERFEPLYDKLVAWHDWYMTWRLDRGAVCITHPWEAGRDNAPDWDSAMANIDPVGVGEYQRRDTAIVDSDMRPKKFDYDRYIWLVNRGRDVGWDDAALLEDPAFRVADPTMTFILLRAQRDLAAMGRLLGRDVSAIEAQISVLEEGAQTLWNSELSCFDSRDALTGTWANSISNASFLCWYAGIDQGDMQGKLRNVLDQVEYGVPSLTSQDERFDSKRYWRGPVWAIMNTMITMGLEEFGLPEAERVKQSTRQLIEKFGFAEYFDPTNGHPAGGSTFTWTAAVWLAWLSPNAKAASGAE